MNGFGRRDDDRVVVDELNVISVDGELFIVSVGCNVDWIFVWNWVDSVLNVFFGFDVNGVVVFMVVFIVVFLVVVFRFCVLVLVVMFIFLFVFIRILV